MPPPAAAPPATPCGECPHRRTSICHLLGQGDTARLEAERTRQFSLAAKRMLIRESDTPSEVFRLYSGWGVRFKILANGSRQILSFALPGDFLTLELLHEAPARFSILTLTRMTLCAFQRERTAKEAFADREGATSVARRWANRVHDLEHHVTMLGRMPATGRIAGLVLHIFQRLKRRGMTVGNEFAFPLRHEDLADALGLTPAHVSRTLATLRQDRLLEIHAARAVILDCDGLHKLAI